MQTKKIKKRKGKKKTNLEPPPPDYEVANKNWDLKFRVAIFSVKNRMFARFCDIPNAWHPLKTRFEGDCFVRKYTYCTDEVIMFTNISQKFFHFYCTTLHRQNYSFTNHTKLIITPPPKKKKKFSKSMLVYAYSVFYA